jgi:hypothetical protein
MYLLICNALLAVYGWGAGETTDGLIHTTRDYYFDAPSGCLTEGNCVADFSLIIEMKIAVTVKDEVKQAAYEKAVLKFAVGKDKLSGSMPLVMKVAGVREPAPKQVVLTFIPEYEAKKTYRPVQSCTFVGTVKERGGMEGVFTFQFSDGSSYALRFG